MNAEKLLPGLRALVARRLVERFGFKQKEVAQALGLSPSAITQYIKGGRALSQAGALNQPEVMSLVDELCEKVAARKGQLIQAEFLQLLYEASRLLQMKRPPGEGEAPSVRLEGKDQLLETLKSRLQAEQEAAEMFMGMAVHVRNDLSRLLFRQVASDSIRHADIVMAIISAVERGEEGKVDLPSVEELKRLHRYEEVAHVHSLDRVQQLFPSPIIAALLETVEADEEKHSRLLSKLIEMSSAEPRA